MERYDYILAGTLGQFQKKARCLVGDASDEALKFKIIAAELARLYDELDRAKAQMFPDTAEGEYLERHGAVRGIVKKSATPASGTVVFTLKNAADTDLLIPSGTLLASSKNAGITLHTTADVTLRKGASSAAAPAETSGAGAGTNIAPHYVDILVTPLAGISGVDNPDTIAGGADAEEEESFRRRVLESFSRISNGANLSYYEQFARSFPDVWYAKAVFTPGVSNEISLYVENYARTLSDSTLAQLQEAVESARELNIRVSVKRPALKKVDVTLLLRVDNLANEGALRRAAEDTTKSYLLSLGVGERFSPAALSAALLKNDGLRDIAVSLPAGPVEAGAGEICGPGLLRLSAERA